MMSVKNKSMIRWKLRELMARYQVSNRQLAEQMGKHETSISRLKKDEMPRVDGDLLDQICIALTYCLQRKEIPKIVTPFDLIEFQWDGDPVIPPPEKAQFIQLAKQSPASEEGLGGVLDDDIESVAA